MAVPIDRDLVQQLIEIKYGSVDQLAACSPSAPMELIRLVA